MMLSTMPPTSEKKKRAPKAYANVGMNRNTRYMIPNETRPKAAPQTTPQSTAALPPGRGGFISCLLSECRTIVTGVSARFALRHLADQWLYHRPLFVGQIHRCIRREDAAYHLFMRWLVIRSAPDNRRARHDHWPGDPPARHGRPSCLRRSPFPFDLSR